MDISYKNIWRIAFPVLVSLLLEHLINLTDTAFLGHIGEVELGASALAGVYYMAIYMLGFGFSIGVQILIGRRNGEGRYGEIGGILSQGIGFLLILALVMFLFSRLVTPHLLRELISSQEVYRAVVEYLEWRVFGFFFSFVAISYRAFFIGITQTKTLTLNAVVMVGSNVLFNYVLIFGKFGFPALGMAGAAIGSSLAEFISMMFYIIYTRGRVDGAKYNLFRRFTPNWVTLRQVFRVSVWTMLQSFMFPSQWFLYFTAVEHLGERSLAIANIIRSVNTCFFMVIFAFADTTSALVSNMAGENRAKSELWLVCRKSIGLAYMIGIPFLVVTGIFPQAVIGVFTNEAALIAEAIPTMYVMLLGYLLAVPALIFFNAVSGSGNTFTSMRIMFVTIFAYIVYVIVVVVWLKMNVAVSWTSEYVYSAMLLTLSLLFLRRNNWRKVI